MEDFNALAAAVAAGVDDVRGCLILSRDGLVLGAFPASAESQAKPAWLRLAAIGDVERGFLQFGTEVWCYVRRGAYAAFTLAGTGIRPGLLIDQMEQALLTAEEARSRREGLRGGESTGATAPSGKPRSPLHPEPRPEPASVPVESAPAFAAAEPGPSPVETLSVFAAREAAPPADPEPAPTAQDRSGDAEPAEEPGGATPEVDRFSLAREFSQLLQDEGGGADG